MKAGLIAASAVALLQLAAAQPHGQHRHQHEKRAVVYTTVVLPEVVVYVNEEGSTIGLKTAAVTPTTSSSTSSIEATTSSSSSSTSSSSSLSPSSSTVESPVAAYVPSSSSSSKTPTPPPPSTTSTPPPAPATSAAPAPSSAAAAPAPAPAAPVSSGGKGAKCSSFKGATYDPYESDGTCKSSTTVGSDMETLAGQGFDAVRVYGVECGTLSSVVPAAKTNGLQVIAGIFNIGSVSSSISSMLSQLNNDLSYLHTISVYNEAINNGQLSAAAVASAIGEAKSALSSTNFAGSVIAVDTFNQMTDPANSAVIDASDYVAANCHAYFDTDIGPDGAGDFVQTNCIDALTKIAGGKDVCITESGWPAGGGNENASPSGQATALGQLRGMNLFALSYFSTAWHMAPTTVENYWGFGGS